MSAIRLPTYFLSHGGGPWPYMDGPVRAQYAALEQSLKDVPRQIGRLPKAVLIITGHWEEAAFTVSAAPLPPMIYDYSGFPPHTYEVRYTAPGSPALAARVHDLITTAGIACHTDPGRGFDHGTFTLMQVMRPEADIPVVQLSIRQDFDPRAHIALGHALTPLRDEDVLIIGSGLSYHNLRLWGSAGAEASRAFDGWLQDTLVSTPPDQRNARLERWADAPAARLAHAREDHLLPLMVAVGAAAAESGACVYHEAAFMGSLTTSSFRFG